MASVDFGDIELNVIGLPVLDTMDQVDRLTRAVMDLPLVGIGGEGMPWYAGFRGADLTAGGAALPENWGGCRGISQMARWFGAGGPWDADLYWAICAMGDGETRRSAGGAVGQSVLIADDIGTKVDVAAWEHRFAMGCPRPTMEIETSPGNRTFVWALDGDGKAPARWADLALIRAWMIEDDLTDRVMDICRYVRLPCGWNSKQKYKAAGAWVGGRPPGVRMLAWRPGRVDFEALGAALVGGAGGSGPWRDRGNPVGAAAQSALTGNQLVAGGALVRAADLGRPDAIMGLGVRLGMDLTSGSPGVVHGLCPNRAMHTVRAETGFAFLGGGLMHCNHASCQELSTRDFRAMMLAEYERGANVGAGEPARGEDWLAGEELRLAGALTAAGVAEAQAEAVRLGGNRAARVAAQQATFSSGLDGLAERFVWINSQGCFFDTLMRELVSEKAIDTHPAVMDVIPPGKSGPNRAKNKILSHPGRQVASGVVRAPGEPSGVVLAVNERGVAGQMANIWTPSVWHGQEAARRPVEWLELLEFVIPDRDYREWLVKWLAWGFQRPWERRMTVPLLVGGQGVGKDAILVPIRLLVGEHNVKHLTSAEMQSGFTDWMLSDLVVLPELKLSGDGSMYNQIKGWLANKEDWVSINEKYRAPYKVRANYSLVSMTNHLDGLKGLEPDDRRWQVYVSDAVKADKAFYDRVIDGAKTDDALAGLLHHLLHEVDLTGFGVYSPAPGADKYRDQMLSETLTGAAQWAYQALDVGGVFAHRQVVTIAEVERAAHAAPSCNPKNAITSAAIRNGLKAQGWVGTGQIKNGQSRISPWIAPSLAAGPGRKGPKPAEVAALYEADLAADAARTQAALLGS